MTDGAEPDRERVFTYGAPPLKFGEGAADELGFDLGQLGVRRALLVTDAGVLATGAPHRIAEQARRFDVELSIYDGVRVEPTDSSLRAAAEYARSAEPWDGLVAVGGGSSIDTAKAMNLLAGCPGDLMDYVNPPIGGGRKPSGPLRPLVAVPTTAGTGSESTSVCVLDLLALKVKTGISNAALRPRLAVVDPLLTHTAPPAVTAAAGLDVLCHALESYTARDFRRYPRRSPAERVPYCGANPVSDVWSEQALALLSRALRRAVRDGDDAEARADMALAATFAGMGFGNAGVHIPHANGYPVAGRVRDFRAPGYPDDEALVPHGFAVAVTAPAAFRFTFPAAPERHLRASRLLDSRAGAGADPAGALPGVLTQLMRDVGAPNGLCELGYGDTDVDDLVAGTLQQARLLAIAPRELSADDAADVFRASMGLW